MSISRIKMGEGEEEEDRISALPDYVIYVIFKFMGMREIIHVSLLSKRWRTLWKSTSYLNFDLQPSEWNENFVDAVLLLHNHSFDIHTFYLASVTCQPTKLDVWVTYVMSRNIQEVTLDSVQMNVPTVAALCGKVKCLTLTSADFLFETCSHELLLSCPIMEYLELGGCGFYNVDNVEYQVECCNIKLCAPNLKVFKFDGCSSKNYILENLSNLVTVIIDVDIWPDGDTEKADLLDNILGGLLNIESFVFSLNNIPGNSKIPISLNKVATLKNLRYLKLMTWEYGDSPRSYCFSTVLKLLEKSPNVETLVVDSRLDWEPEIFAEEDLVAGLKSWCKLCHLKTFKIEGEEIEVSDCAFKFLECLMENTMSLQKVVMTTSNTKRDKKNLVNLCKRLKMPSRMTIMGSNRVGVSLKPSRRIHWEIE